MKRDNNTQPIGTKRGTKNCDDNLDEHGLRIEVGIRISRGGVGVVDEVWCASEMKEVLKRHRIQDAFRSLHEIGLMHFKNLYIPAINELLRAEIERLKEKDRRDAGKAAPEVR